MNDRPPRPQVIRRRVRESQIIELPDVERPPAAPHVRTHAKRFATALALLMIAGGALLATPWASESGERTPIIDALFTAVSAAAVTGLVTVDTASHWSWFGELIILCLIQAGGLGFMVGAALLLQMLRRGQARLSDMLLMHDGAPTLSIQEAKRLTGRIIRFTFAVEAIGAVVLAARFSRDMPFGSAVWHGVFHSISAFCNAGFDLQGSFASLAGHRDSVTVNAAVMLLIQAGSLSYLYFADVVTCRSWRRLALDTKLVLIVNGLMLVFGTAGFLISESRSVLSDEGLAGKVGVSAFQSVAARTAGFATINWGEVNSATMFIWLAVMLVGGAAGSTAGGVKLATIGVVFVAVLSTLRGESEARAFGRTIPTPIVLRAAATIFLFVFAHFLITLSLLFTEDYLGDQDFPLMAVMFETMSGIATVGLSTGITPELTPAGKAVLCVAMFFGRLGPLTVAYALQRRQKPVRYRFPTAPVRIG